MAQYHDTIPVPKRTVVALTSGAVTAARVQVLGPGTLMIQATTANVAPTPAQFGGAIHAQGGYKAGFDTDRTLAERFAGRITTTGYLWGYTEDDGVQASITHA